jgi:hydrogenase maturation protease
VTGPRAPIAVLGVGNVLLRDDGVGVRVAEALERLAAHDPSVLPTCTHIVDGGTLDVGVLRAVEGARALLVVDGMDLDEPPGTVRVLRGDAITVAGTRTPGGGGGGIGELLALGRVMGWIHGPVALVAVQVGDVTFNLGLSVAVEAALPAAVEAARRTLWELDAEAVGASKAGRAHASDPGPGAPGGDARPRAGAGT